MSMTPFSGRAPALSRLNRRSLLTGATVLTAAPFAAHAFPPFTAAPDPLPSLLAQRNRAELVWLDTLDDTPEAEAAWDVFKQIEAMIERTVATTPEGIAAQIEHMKREYGDPSRVPPPEEEQRINDVPLPFINVILAGLVTIGGG